MQQKLVSIDVEFSGMVAEVRGFRVDASGATRASVVLQSPGAWYSGLLAVDVKSEHLRLVAATEREGAVMRISETSTADDVERAYRAEVWSGRSPDEAYVVVSNDLHEGLRAQRITPVQWRRLRRRLEGA